MLLTTKIGMMLIPAININSRYRKFLLSNNFLYCRYYHKKIAFRTNIANKMAEGVVDMLTFWAKQQKKCE